MARLRWPVISLLPYVNKTPIYIVLSVQIRETNRIRSSAYNLLSEVPLKIATASLMLCGKWPVFGKSSERSL